MNKTKYFLYARKSSEAEERQAMSIEAQLVELSQFAQREGLSVVERFIESKSAKTPGRPEFNRMVEKIYASREPVGILSWHPDRLARNSVDGGQVVYLIDSGKLGALKFPTFWFEPTPQGLFMLQVAFGQSKYYSDNLSENVKRGIRQKLRRGEYYGQVPYGYVYNHKTRNVEPDPVRSKVVKRMYQEFASGRHSLASIGRWLAEFGMLSKKGKVLAKSSVEHILNNQTYLGVITIKGETYEGTFEPLVSRAAFEAVQAVLKRNSRPRKSNYTHDFPFTDLLVCGECGCSITAQYAKGNGGTYIYYRCTKKKHRCSQGYVRDDKLLEQLHGAIQKVVLPAGWVAGMRGQVDEWARLERKSLLSEGLKIDGALEETEAKLDKLINAFLDGLIEKEIYLVKKEELIKRKLELNERKVGFARDGLIWLEPLRDWLEALAEAEKLASSNDLYEVKSFVEKIGANRLLRDREVFLDFAQPFDLILKHNDLRGAQTKQPAPKGRVASENIAVNTAWWAVSCAKWNRRSFRSETRPTTGSCIRPIIGGIPKPHSTI